MARRPTTVRVARWSATHPWRAIGAWVLFVAICVGAGAATGTREADEDDGAGGELARYLQIVEDGDFDDPAAENVLVTARDGRLDPAAADAAARDVARQMAALPGVAAVDDPLPAPDGSAVLVGVTLAGDPDTAGERVQPLLDTTAAVAAAHPDLRVEQVGGASLGNALDDTLGDDFRRAELVSIPLTVAILLLAFGAFIAAGIPVVLALSAVAAALGLTALTSVLVPSSETTNSIVLLIGLAVGVDYSLFYIRREREERARGADRATAVDIAAATSGRAIVVSGVAVIVAMSGMYIAGDPIFSSMAIGTSLVVGAAVLGSITVLPALLAKLGRWVDRPRVPLVWRLSARSGGRPRFWTAVLRPTLRRPAVAALVSGGALVALALPATGMQLTVPSDADLPRSIPAMQTYDRLTTAFPSTGVEHDVAVRVPPDADAAVRTALDDLADRVAADPLFAQDRPPQVRTSADGRVVTASIGVPGSSDSPGAVRSLDVLRGELLPATVGAVAGVEHAVGGMVAGDRAFLDDMTGALPWVITFVLALTFLVMVATFRSVVVALTAIALNTLSAAAAYGLLVLVFQGEWAEGLLGFESNGGIVAWLPLVLFVTLFGLSMDYHVFVVSRIREAALRGVPTRQAVAEGITGSAGVVTSAAAVMVAVFAVFATLSTLDMKQLGVGLAAAILLDATLIRAVLLPSVMALLGRWNWWAPRWVRPAADELAPAAIGEGRRPEPVAAH